MFVIFGGAGVVGKKLTEILKYPDTPLLVPGDKVDSYTRDQVDITNYEEIDWALSRATKPIVVINCAAVTDVGAITTYPGIGVQVNALGAANVALACRVWDARLIHISTDYVFNGYNGPYLDTDRPYPINAYGYSKWLGEELVRALASYYWIVRVGWLYGKEYPNCAPMIAAGERLMKDRDGNTVKRNAYIWNDIYGTPTFVDHFVSMLAQHAARINLNPDHGWDRVWNRTIHSAPHTERPVTWYEALKSRFPDITPYSSMQGGGTRRPVRGGLIPTRSWMLPSIDDGLDDFWADLNAKD